MVTQKRTNRHKLRSYALNSLLILGFAVAIGYNFFPHQSGMQSDTHQNAHVIKGKAHVADGDSLKIGKTRIRLYGIDAPEKAQNCQKNGQTWPCGRDAHHFLISKISGQMVVCKGTQWDRYHRLLATCYVGEINLNQLMMLEGFAVSFSAYKQEENLARRDKKGLWAGQFEWPQNWRRAHPR